MITSDMIKRALREDTGRGDITSEAVIPKGLEGRGLVVAKQELVLAGLEVACRVFLTLDPTTKIKQLVSDGQKVRTQTPVLKVEGCYRHLLQGERLALNFLQRLSGIATLTRKFVEQTEGTKTRILDTRKTTPLFRSLEKYAVRMGGGFNHRLGLFDAVLIKDNHIAACGGDVEEAIRRMKKKAPKEPVTVEIAKISDVEIAVSAGAKRLLLDNMSDAEIERAVAAVRRRAEIEVSGGSPLSVCGGFRNWVWISFRSGRSRTRHRPSI